MNTKMIQSLSVGLLVASVSIALQAAEKPTVSAGVPVTMTVTANVAGEKRMPQIEKDDLIVKLNKQRVKVTEWASAQGDRAGLELFFLIDDASDSSLSSHLDEMATFINAQPDTTQVGVGYMRNGTVQMVQNFTKDHAAAAKALRLPLGNGGAFGSPYLSVIDLMKRWPASKNRHEIIMVTDGIDRARRGYPWRGLYVNPDVDSAAEVAMRTATIVHTIYAPGVGRRHRNYWEASNGQMGIAKLSDVTGGESYFLGFQSAVSFTPYLDQVQRILENQYRLTVSAMPGKKAGLQNVSLDTEVAGVDLAAADAVWVPAAK